MNRTLQETTNQITGVVQTQNQSSGRPATDSTQPDDSNIFQLIYGTFSAGIAKLKKLFSEVEKRRNGLPE